MSKYPQFSVSFSIGPTNKERLEAFEIYRRAFKAKKVSESTPPDCDDIHIMMDIYGTEILIGPGNVAGTGTKRPKVNVVGWNRATIFSRVKADIHIAIQFVDPICQLAITPPQFLYSAILHWAA